MTAFGPPLPYRTAPPAVARPHTGSPLDWPRHPWATLSVLAVCALLVAPAKRSFLQDAPAPPAAAAPAPTPALPDLVVDPDQAAALAIRNSTQLRIDAQTVEEAIAQLKQVWAMDGFDANVGASVMYQGPKPSLPPEFSSFFVTVSHAETLSVSKPLWSGGRLEAAVAQARQGIKVAQSAADVTKLAAARLARDTVLKLGLDERLEGVDYATLAGLMEHERVTDKRYREGLIAFFEVAQAQAQVASQQRIITEKEQDVVKSRVLLRRILNVDQRTPITVAVGRMPERPPGQLDEVIAYALDHRPEMNRARRAVELAEVSLRVIHRSLRPSVVVSGLLENQTASLLTSGISYQIVLAYQQPLWDGGAKNAQVKQQRARVQETQLAMEQQAELIAQDVAEQYLQIDLYRRRITEAEVQERAALEQLRIARLRFQEDLGLGEEVITAQGVVAQAQTSRANAESDLHTALFRLRAAMGMADLQEAKAP